MTKFSAATLPKSDRKTERLVKELDKALDVTRASSQNDPFSNSVLLSALAISRRLGEGSLKEEALAKLCNRLCIRAAAMRVERHYNYLEELDIDANLKRAEKLFGNDFVKFKQVVSSPFWGIVFTAHPTFALSQEALCALSDLTNGTKNDASQKSELLETLAEQPSTKKPTLNEEHQLSLRAIKNARKAHRMLLEQMFKWARKKWGAKADTLRPKFMTIATWVGYDLDGRVDITWRQTIHKRMIVAQEQLAYYCSQMEKLKVVPETQAKLKETLKMLEEEIPAFEDESIPLAPIARKMEKTLKRRITDPDQVIKSLEANATSDKVRILISELKTLGMGVARTHVRLNAKQLHNALIEDLKIEVSQELSSAIPSLEKLLSATKPVQINFGDLETERTSAKRLFMIVRQMLKYIDSKTPIRILIAECESHADLLAALYLAKLFKVEHKVDICPF